MTPAELIAELECERQVAEAEDARVLKAPLLQRIIALVGGLETVPEQPVDAGSDVIDAKLAAKMLGWSKRTVWDHASTYPFAWKEGGRWKFSRSGIRRWIAQHAT